MRIERIEVFGFKSFMERLVLPLESGITGVVGPNGCGKSNIIDALRWVLGETRASQLRGGVLEDVIFNGTENLRPLGLAEVSLVIRAEKASLYDDLLGYYEQAELARDADGVVDAQPSERAQETDPEQQAAADELGQIATPAPENTDSLAEVHATAALEASNADVPVEGGPESALTEVSNSEDPNPDSELSGSERGQANLAPEVSAATAALSEPGLSADVLADIKASLVKYAWLRSVSEVQVTRRLYRSGESEFFINKVPARLKDLKELFRIVGLAARGYTIIAQGEIGRIITAKPDDRRHVIEEAAHIAGFREHMTAVSKRVEDTKTQVLRLDDVIKEVTRQVAHLKRQAARAATRAELKQELIGAEKQLFTDMIGQLAKKLGDVRTRCEALVEDETVAAAALSEARNHEQEARETAARFESEMDVLRRRADELKDELNKSAREVSAKESRLREVNALIAARNTEIRRLEERKVVLSQRREESVEALARLEAQEREVTESLETIDTSGEEEMKVISSSLQQLREDQRNQDRLIRELRDKLVSAQSRRDALQAQLTAASPLTHLKRALGADNKLPPEVVGNAKLLVDGMRVPDQYAKAVHSVLAERASFLVVDDVSKVARAFQELVLKADPQNKKGLGVGLFAALPLTQKAATFVGTVEGVIPLLPLVEVAEWAQGLVSKLLDNVWVARDLDAAAQFLEAKKAAGQADDDAVIVTEGGDLLSAWSFYSFRHEGGVIQMKSKVDEAVRLIEENQGVYDTLVSERDDTIRRISEGERRHFELVRELQQAQSRLRELGQRQGEVRGRLHSERRVTQQIEGDLERIAPQMEELQQQLALLQRTIAEVTDELEVLKSRDNSEAEAAYQEVQSELRAMDDQRRKLRDSMGQFLREAELKRQAHEALRDRLMRERMGLERFEGELNSIRGRVRERYGDELLQEIESGLDSIQLMVDQARRELEGRVHAIRQRLDREGEVDPTVVEQYEVENNRLVDLTSQREDLTSATQTLEATLTELRDACNRRFSTTFAAIRDNFAFFGPKLFGGGSAELALIDPAKPLESGVEIIVRPPGKKPKSIDLLSGGEKALCAIALVFSMFMVRPSPLCVLDEVDAPLDEANVHRFVSFIKEMSSRTQFLMVTHNKQSMAAADTLVGVTMPTPGASKVLTVSLQEAVKQVA